MVNNDNHFPNSKALKFSPTIKNTVSLSYIGIETLEPSPQMMEARKAFIDSIIIKYKRDHQPTPTIRRIEKSKEIPQVKVCWKKEGF